MRLRVGNCLRSVLERLACYYRRRPGLWWTFLAALIYTIATLVVTHPLVFQLSSALGGIGDSYEYTWVLWRVKQFISGGSRGLADVPWLNHPVGQYHPFLLTMLTVDLTALPFLLVLPPLVVYNLHVLTGFVLCGLSTYWFARELTGNQAAGLVSGFVFAFFSNKTGHAMHGHLPQTLAYWGPLFALFLWRVVWKPGWRKGLVCGLVLVAALLVHPLHAAYFILPLALAILLYALVRLRRQFFYRGRLCALALAFGLAALVVVPIWWPSIATQQDQDYLTVGGTVKFSADLLALFTPSPYHPVLGPLGWVPSYAEKVFPDQYSLYEGLAYPGLLVTLLGGWALVRRWRQTWIWGMLAVVSLVLSLGPILKVGGELAVYKVDEHRSHIVLPYALVKALPLFSVSRTPNRINETAMFALAVLVAFGFAALTQRLAGRRLLTILAGLVGIGILFEHLVMWPLPQGSAGIPSVSQAIAAEDSEGALLYLPSLRWKGTNHLSLYYQTVCERPIVGGMVHRSVSGSLSWETMLYGLAQADPVDEDIVPRPDLSQRRAWLRHFDIDYVVLHNVRNQRSDRDVTTYRPFVQELLGPATLEDDKLAAFAVPADLTLPVPSFLYTLGRGWSAPVQGGGDGASRRWICCRGGRVYVYATEAREGRVVFIADAQHDFAQLQLRVDDSLEEQRFIIGERTAYASQPFAWQPGLHTVRFAPAGDCDETLSEDCHTFALEDIRIVSESELPSGVALDINLADRVHLAGYALDTSALHPGGTLTVTLNWRAVTSVHEDLVAFVHLLDEDGTLVAQVDAEPADGRFPTSAWAEGSTLGYAVALPLPEDLPPGEYRLLVGMYHWPSLERLPVLSDVPGAENGTVELEWVSVAP